MYTIPIPRIYSHNKEMCESIAKGWISAKHAFNGDYDKMSRIGNACIHLLCLGFNLYMDDNNLTSDDLPE